MFARIAEIADAVAVPVNADLEAGYGDTPEAVAATISKAIASGVAGANIEDRDPVTGRLYDAGLARERISAAVEAVGTAGRPFVLTARCDAGLVGESLDEAIVRLRSYQAAGAGCLFAPGFSDVASAEILIGELEAPLNFVAGLSASSAAPRDLIALGARRISLGGSIARSALGLVRAAAEELRDSGTIDFAARQIAQDELNMQTVPDRLERRDQCLLDRRRAVDDRAIKIEDREPFHRCPSKAKGQGKSRRMPAPHICGRLAVDRRRLRN